MTKQELDNKAIEDYNILAFLCQTIIPVIDRLKETNQYRHLLKKAANEVLRECEKVTKRHWDAYEQYGDLPNEERVIHSRQIHAITSRAYDAAVAILTTMNASEITSLVYLAKDTDLSKVEFEYKPLE